MRGTDERSGKLFSYVDLEQRVPARHPLRAIRESVNEALVDIGPGMDAAYSRIGRPSIAPEKLLRALLLQLFHRIRSERQMMERLDFDLSFRWFVGLGIDDQVWDASTFSKNRERLLDGEIAARFLSAILGRPQVKRLLSTEHFSVDGTLIEAWCSMKSFRPRMRPERMNRQAMLQAGATTRSISAAPGAATIPMRRPPIRMHACIARVPALVRSSATWDTS